MTERNRLRELHSHLPEYAMEAFGLGIFMVSAVGFSVLLFADDSFGATRIDSDLLRRFVMGLAMGLTAVALITSPMGKRSGAHLNPAVTLTFLRLRRIRAIDAFGYIAFQFLGAVLGVATMRLTLGNIAILPPVNLAVTSVGATSVTGAFVAEVAISYLMMSIVLYASNHAVLSKWVGWIAGGLVCLFITFEAPLSGMSMNPARSLGSALVAGSFQDLWVYFVAPPIGMLLAAETMVRVLGSAAILCAKLQHDGRARCIFVCRFDPSALLGSVK